MPEIASLNLNLEIEINVEDPLPTINDSLKTTLMEETITTESIKTLIVAAVEAEIENEYEDAETDREGRENVFFNSTDSGSSRVTRKETTLITRSDSTEANVLSSRQTFDSTFSTNSQTTSIKLSPMDLSNKTADSTTIKFSDIQNKTSISPTIEYLNETMIPSISNSTKNQTSSVLFSKTTESIFETTTLIVQEPFPSNITDNSTVIGSKTTNVYNNWSLLQLLFFLIFLIALGNF